MFKKGEFVVYKRDVVEIVDTKINRMNHQEYYVLVPVNDESLKIDVPIDNRLGHIRPLITKDEIENLIKIIPSIPLIETNNKLIENDYRILMNDTSHESLIKIIKTTYLRNKECLDNNKKVGDKDNYYFDLAEKYLYTEFAYSLNISYDEASEYILKEVAKLTKD